MLYAKLFRFLISFYIIYDNLFTYGNIYNVESQIYFRLNADRIWASTPQIADDTNFRHFLHCCQNQDFRITNAVGLTRVFCVLIATNSSESRIVADYTDFADFKSFLILRVFSPVETVFL